MLSFGGSIDDDDVIHDCGDPSSDSKSWSTVLYYTSGADDMPKGNLGYLSNGEVKVHR